MGRMREIRVLDRSEASGLRSRSFPPLLLSAGREPRRRENPGASGGPGARRRRRPEISRPAGGRLSRAVVSG